MWQLPGLNPPWQFFPAFDPKMELLQDKHSLPFLKNCFQLFFPYFLERKLLGENRQKINSKSRRLWHAKRALQICPKWSFARAGRPPSWVHMEGCWGHHPSCLAPREQTGSWQHIAAPELQAGTRLHLTSKRHVRILQCLTNVPISLLPG